MNQEQAKAAVGANIAAMRKKRGLTQAELAERINYSDKAVSKWERGESLPDVLTLLALAEQLQTDPNTLTGCEAPAAEPQPQPENPAPQPEPARKNESRRQADKRVILKLCSILVWAIALLLYIILDAFGIKHLWLLFVGAVPVAAIVQLSLRSAWKLFGWNRFLISLILWGSLLTLYLLLLVCCNVNVWRMLLIGLLGQAAILLWFKMFRRVEEDPNE